MNKPKRMSSIDVKPNKRPGNKLKRMKKAYRSSYSVWLESVPELAGAVSLIKQLTAHPPVDEPQIIEAQRRLHLLEYQLKLNREVRETCQDELKNRKLMVELRKLEMDSMGDEELELMFVETAKIRGYRKVSLIRANVREALLKLGLEPKVIEDMLNEAVPAVPEGSTRTLAHRIRVDQERMAEQMEEGARALMEGLECLDDRSADVTEHQDDPSERVTDDLGANPSDGAGPLDTPEELG